MQESSAILARESSDYPDYRPRSDVSPLTRLLYIAYFFEVGVLLMLIPWSVFWERNYFSASLPVLQGVIGNHFVRGAVSGLGLVNLGAAVAELVTLLASRGRGASGR
jgi:hypothetical protein